MITNFDTNDVVRMFQARARAELKRELDEAKWWENLINRGVVKRQHAEGYIQISKRIIKTKRHVLGIPEFPC
jgi:predicted ATPase